MFSEHKIRLQQSHIILDCKIHPFMRYIVQNIIVSCDIYVMQCTQFSKLHLYLNTLGNNPFVENMIFRDLLYENCEIFIYHSFAIKLIKFQNLIWARKLYSIVEQQTTIQPSLFVVYKSLPNAVIDFKSLLHVDFNVSQLITKIPTIP